VLPVTLDEPAVLQSIDHPVHSGTRPPCSFLDFPAVDVSSVSMCAEQDFKHVESRLCDALDASHGAYIT
jgi:hypothetical protein